MLFHLFPFLQCFTLLCMHKVQNFCTNRSSSSPTENTAPETHRQLSRLEFRAFVTFLRHQVTLLHNLRLAGTMNVAQRILLLLAAVLGQACLKNEFGNTGTFNMMCPCLKGLPRYI